MTKKASLSETKQAQILILPKKGILQRKICKNVSCNKTAVHQPISRF